METEPQVVWVNDCLGAGPPLDWPLSQTEYVVFCAIKQAQTMPGGEDGVIMCSAVCLRCGHEEVFVAVPPISDALPSVDCRNCGARTLVRDINCDADDRECRQFLN